MLLNARGDICQALWTSFQTTPLYLLDLLERIIISPELLREESKFCSKQLLEYPIIPLLLQSANSLKLIFIILKIK